MTIGSPHRARGLVVLLAATLLTSGCKDPQPSPPSSTVAPSTTPAPSSPQPSTSASPTPTALTPAEKDRIGAAETVTRYWAVLDDVATDPAKSLNLIATVARDQAADQARVELGSLQTQGWTQVGRSSVESAQATTKDGKTFTVTACVDVSGVDIVDKAGKSVVRSGRPDRQKYTYTVVKTSNGFFVTVDTLKGEPC